MTLGQAFLELDALAVRWDGGLRDVHKSPGEGHQYPRPQDSESTASRPICAVNRSAAQLVPWWGTTWESWVLWFLDEGDVYFSAESL